MCCHGFTTRIFLLFSCQVVPGSLRPHGCSSPSPGVHPGSCRLNQWCSEDLEDPLPVHQCLRSQAGLSHSHGHPFSSKDAWPSSLAAAPDHPHVAGSPLLLSGLLSGPVASSLCQGCTWHPHSMAHGGPKSLGFWSHLAFTWGKGWFIYHLRKPLI